MNASSPLPPLNPETTGVTVMIRFANHRSTLQSVLESLQAQTVRPKEILGINNNSTDGSTELLLQAGARIVDWPAAYQPAKALNFGMSHCATELVLIISAHMTLASRDGIERLVAAVSEPGVACASHFWQLGFHGESVTWQDLESLGMPYSAIYTNVCGMLRRSCWTRRPFSEGAGVVDDYDWVLSQLQRGHRCRRVALEFRYERKGAIRYYLFTRHVRALAHCYGLRFTEASAAWAVGEMVGGIRTALASPSRWRTGYALVRHGAQMFVGRLTWWPLVAKMRAGRKLLDDDHAREASAIADSANDTAKARPAFLAEVRGVASDIPLPLAITVAICTHNPRREVLLRTLESLRVQAVGNLRLELLIIDNASNPPLTAPVLGLDRFPFPARVVGEEKLGLTPARWRAYHEATGDVVLYVDDDNFLAPDYAAEVSRFFRRHPKAGVVGGRTLPLPETPIPSWMTPQLLSHLAVRDPGDAPIRFLDDQTPYGAGMAVRREAMKAARVESPVFSDRKGQHLSSFGDSELCYRIRIAGWELWYEPALRLEHFLSAHRLTKEYYLRFLSTMGRDWPKLEFFWVPGTPWRRLSYLKRAFVLALRDASSSRPADLDERVRWEFERAFNRGLRRSLVRLAVGPAVWRGVPCLTPGK